jgi:hypothetical protein
MITISSASSAGAAALHPLECSCRFRGGVAPGCAKKKKNTPEFFSPGNFRIFFEIPGFFSGNIFGFFLFLFFLRNHRNIFFGFVFCKILFPHQKFSIKKF